MLTAAVACWISPIVVAGWSSRTMTTEVVTWIGCRQAVIEGADHRDGIKEMSPQRRPQAWLSNSDGFRQGDGLSGRSLDRCVDAEFVEALPDRAPQPVERITDLGPVVHRQ